MKSGITIGMDMGDRNHSVCELNADGKVVGRRTVSNTRVALVKYFSDRASATVVLEAGTHSAWVSELLGDLGHEVVVANPRKLKVIWANERKSDKRDAELLARTCRLDRELLCPIRHRSRSSRLALEYIKARDELVGCRTSLVNHVRGIVKGFGYRVSSGGTKGFVRRAKRDIPEEVLVPLDGVLSSLEELDRQIRQYDKKIEKLCKDDYPETQALRAVKGVGPITALAYILIIEDPSRFAKSRDVGPFLGLVPRRDQSGEQDKQLPITKAGNAALRCLLVNCAQHILGAFGPDCDLRRYGLRIASRGGKNAKRRAVVAVARKLSVLLHRLWSDAPTAYDPLYSERNDATSQAA